MPRTGLRSSVRAGFLLLPSVDTSLSSNRVPSGELTPQNNVRSPFMEITPELRLTIYRYVFDAALVIYHVDSGDRPTLLWRVQMSDYGDVLQVTMHHNALLRVSKHINQEAVRVYHSRATFMLSGLYATRPTALYQLSYLFKNIQHLTIHGFQLQVTKKIPKFEKLKQLALLKSPEYEIRQAHPLPVPNTLSTRLLENFNTDRFMRILNENENTHPAGRRIAAFKAKLPKKTRLIIQFDYRYIYNRPDSGQNEEEEEEVYEVYTTRVTYDVGDGSLTWREPYFELVVDEQ